MIFQKGTEKALTVPLKPLKALQNPHRKRSVGNKPGNGFNINMLTER